MLKQEIGTWNGYCQLVAAAWEDVIPYKILSMIMQIYDDTDVSKFKGYILYMLDWIELHFEFLKYGDKIWKLSRAVLRRRLVGKECHTFT